MAALVYGLPPNAGVHGHWGLAEELAATQIEMAHEVRSSIIWNGRIHLGKDATKVPIPERLRVPRPFDDRVPPKPEPRMSLESVASMFAMAGGV